MFWKSSLVIGAALSLCAFPAGAQQSAEFAACMKQADGITNGMLDCGKTEIAKWDRRLNAAYQTLLHRLKGADRAQLQQEQRAWLKHHLRKTRRLAANPDNGSVALLESQSFELDDLIERTRVLEKRVDAEP